MVLPPELLTSVVEFITFAEVHAAPRCVSREWRAAVRRATTHGRWKPVKFVADQGEAIKRVVERLAEYKCEYPAETTQLECPAEGPCGPFVCRHSCGKMFLG